MNIYSIVIALLCRHTQYNHSVAMQAYQRAVLLLVHCKSVQERVQDPLGSPQSYQMGVLSVNFCFCCIASKFIFIRSSCILHAFSPLIG